MNRKALESLARCGALDAFGYHRAALLEELPAALARAASARSDRAAGQGSLFDLLGGDGGGTAETSRREIEEANRRTPKMGETERLLGEKELLGVYLTGHPSTRYPRIVSEFTPFHEVAAAKASLAAKLETDRLKFPEIPPGKPVETDFPDGAKDKDYRLALDRYRERSREIRQYRYGNSREVAFCAFVSQVVRRIDKNGRPWCKLTLEDALAKEEVPVFANDYERLTQIRRGPDDAPPPEIFEDGGGNPGGAPPAGAGAGRAADAAPSVTRDPPEENRSYLFLGAVEPSFRLEASLSIFDCIPVEDVPAKYAERVSLCLDEENSNADTIAAIKETVGLHPGKIPVNVRVVLADGTKVTVAMPDDVRVACDRGFLADAERLVGPRNVHFKFRQPETARPPKVKEAKPVGKNGNGKESAS